VKLLAAAPLPGGVYALAFRPDGSSVAAAGEDGKVRFIDANTGAVLQEFIPVPLEPTPAPLQTASLPASSNP
jgi:WD40 repeat protein